MTTKEEAIAEIMRKFDFEAVHQYMQARNWTWFSTGVPSVEELKRTALGLLSDAVNSDHPDHARNAVGGFEARVDAWDGHQPSLTLSFIPFEAEVWNFER